MPKTIGKSGTGMTERAVVQLDAEVDVRASTEAAVETFERSSFAKLSRRLETMAKGMLDAAGLPSDPELEYLVTSEPSWAPIEPGTVEDETVRWSLPLTVGLCHYPPDSPQGYTARLLMMIAAARRHAAAGKVDEAMAEAFAAGELVTEAAMKDIFEADFVAGEKVRAGGRAAHAGTYGTPAEIEARHVEYAAAVDAALATGLPKMKAYEVVGKQFDVYPDTIRRAYKKHSQPR